VTSYFPDQESLVTILRYRVVIDEIVVSKEKFHEYNLQAGFDDDDELGENVEDFLETKDNKFQDWEWGSPSLMADPRDFVGEAGQGYVAFEGDVTSGSDDLFPMNYDSWSHDQFSPIPFENNDYLDRIGLGKDCEPNIRVIEAMGHSHNLKSNIYEETKKQ
jgi:hypothetical protein